MPDKITQRLGFEAGDAINTITTMTTVLGKLNTKLRAFNKAANASNGSKVIKGFSQVSTAADKASDSLGKVTKKAKTFGKEAPASIQKVTFAWQGLAKALLMRTTVQMLTKLTGAISESADAAAEFEKSVAMISNIAKGAGSGIDELTVSLSQMAVELGRSKEEVTGAAFEALQNDLGSTADTMDLLTGAANNLALVTGGTLTQSVNSLSSVLKAYDMDISEADKVSDQFFAAIDKGRITLAELENSLGKITPLAAKLNISFGQVAGAMAAITQSGTSASVANTQLRSIMQKLIRPTKELDAAFRVLGVKSFKELQERSGGLRQSLQAIASALNNDDKAIAKAFGRLRGQLGVFNLLANGGKIFAETMDAVADSTGKAADGAKRIDNTAARKSEKVWAAFNETMRQVGNTVLDMKTKFIEAFNAIVPSGDALVKLTEGVAALGVALATTATAAKTFTVAMASIEAGVAPLVPMLVLAAAAGVGLGIALDAAFDTYTEKLDAIEKKALDSKEQLAKDTKVAVEEGNRIVSDLLAQRGQSVQKYIDGMERAFDRETEALTSSAEVVGSALKSTINDFASGMNRTIDSMKSKLAGIKDALKGAIADQKSAKQALEDFKFDQGNRGKTALQVFNAEMSRAEKNARLLKKSMQAALTNPEAVDAAKEDIKNLLSQAKALASKAQQFKNPVQKREALDRAASLEKKALEANLKLADNKVNILKRQATATEVVLNKQKAITKELKFQLNLLASQVSLLNEEGNLKAPQTVKADKAKASDTANNIRELLGSLDQGLFESFGTKEQASKLIQNIRSAFSEAQFDFSNISQQINKVIQQGEYKVFADVVLNFKSSGDKTIDEQIQRKAEEAGGNVVKQSEAMRKARADALRDMEVKQKEYDQSVKTSGILEQQVYDQTAVALQNKSLLTIKASSEVWKAYKEIFDQIKSDTTSMDQMPALEGKLNSLTGKIADMLKNGNLTQGFSDSMLAAVDTAMKMIEQKGTTINLKAQFDPTVMENLKNQISSAVSAGAEASEQTVQAVGNINSGLGTTVSMANSAAQAFGRMADEANRAARAAATAGGSKYHGGKIAYRASGGPTRGLDTQLTATSPGEFIMNAGSSRKFFTQLQAMNAGQSPQYRDKGGPVTNNSIGDININMPEGTSVSDPSLVRNIASDLRRELRRQTSIL